MEKLQINFTEPHMWHTCSATTTMIQCIKIRSYSTSNWSEAYQFLQSLRW